MLVDILGNELKIDDIVCVKVTEQVVGRIVVLQEGGKIGLVKGEQVMDVPAEIMMLVEVRRRLLHGNIIDVVKAYQNKTPKSNIQNIQ